MFIILCEDNTLDRENAAQLIKEAANEMIPDHCFQVFEDAESCLKAIRKRPPDIAFIDIFLKKKNGLELAEAVRELNQEAAIVFLTMSNEFASESYRVRAVDYLLKPAGQKQVAEALMRCAKHRNEAVEPLTVHQNREILRIDQRRIEKLESQSNYILIYMNSGEVIRARSTLKKIQAQLNADMLKLRRGVVVNMRSIQTIKNGTCRMKSGEEIILSRHHAKEIREKYYDYQYHLVQKDSL
ncbi:LytTR family DNA-binding domain-containing protein [Eubacterium sp.]|uniref:LytR/AlgR family response regulator transcription factor n=1 Tax=Eubacterium sp. TaxID=142586 RepID=UPI0026E05FCE|nr:LytTR family DNA-binding domain-containing protein [Eubacterium sp.]MDO5431192.1 LytTR family DNA-binding domain-containing protein [Eubacterium sp.]